MDTLTNEMSSTQVGFAQIGLIQGHSASDLKKGEFEPFTQSDEKNNYFFQ